MWSYHSQTENDRVENISGGGGGSNGIIGDPENLNVGIGPDVLNDVTDGTDNTAFGYEAGEGIVEGSNNVCIGSQAYLSTDGDKNVVIGSGNATFTNGTGSVAIGSNAKTTDDNCIAIGRGSSAGTNGDGGRAIAIGVDVRAEPGTVGIGNGSQTPTDVYLGAAGTVTHADILFTELVKLYLVTDFPSSPSEGWVVAKTDHHVYYFNGTTWKQMDN